MQVQTRSLDEFNKAAADFAKLLEPHGRGAAIVTLSGVLGAGKTAFVKEVARTFGVEEDMTSPTYVIERVYEMPDPSKGFSRLIHFDAYRLSKSEELDLLGWKQLLNDEKNLIFLEWPEHVPETVPPSLWKVKITILQDDVREISYVEDK